MVITRCPCFQSINAVIPYVFRTRYVRRCLCTTSCDVLGLPTAVPPDRIGPTPIVPCAAWRWRKLAIALPTCGRVVFFRATPAHCARRHLRLDPRPARGDDPSMHVCRPGANGESADARFARASVTTVRWGAPRAGLRGRRIRGRWRARREHALARC